MDNISSLSSVNQAYINAASKPKLPQEAIIPEKKGVDKRVIVGASVALGAIALGGLIAAGKFKKAQQLAENIDFTPAKTLEEAKEFAKKHLHIDKFELTDLESANYVNEALVNFNNNISTDHKRIIRTVKVLPKDGIQGSFAVNRFGRLDVNEDYLKNIENTIKKFASIGKDYIWGDFKLPSQEELSKMKLGEKLELVDRMQTVLMSGLNPDNTFASFLSKSKVKEFLKVNSNLPQTLGDFMKLDVDAKIKVLVEIKNKTKTSSQNTNSGGPFRIINHEIGHMLHRKNIGEDLFNKYADYGTLVDQQPDIQILWDKFKKEFGEEMYCETIANVTAYTATTPAEFVAEVYSYLCNGVKFSDNIMNLYKKYGGVLPKTVA